MPAQGGFKPVQAALAAAGCGGTASPTHACPGWRRMSGSRPGTRRPAAAWSTAGRSAARARRRPRCAAPWCAPLRRGAAKQAAAQRRAGNSASALLGSAAPCAWPRQQALRLGGGTGSNCRPSPPLHLQSGGPGKQCCTKQQMHAGRRTAAHHTRARACRSPEAPPGWRCTPQPAREKGGSSRAGSPAGRGMPSNPVHSRDRLAGQINHCKPKLVTASQKHERWRSGRRAAAALRWR